MVLERRPVGAGQAHRLDRPSSRARSCTTSGGAGPRRSEHGYVGAKILEEEGVDAVVVEIVRRHVGAGISKEEAASLGFPKGDYIPRTLEEKVVCFADKMVSADSVRPFEEEVKRFERKGHDVEAAPGSEEEPGGRAGRGPGEAGAGRFAKRPSR